ncbi:MAG TPA: tetratricopeptide repeat protein [Kofleriaceae bacterium]|nr:tetratricopeptide repeat protein [Kofleriaceae bacterium]
MNASTNDPTPAGDFDDLRAEVAELGRRVEEQATLARKSQQSVASLAESVASVVARQRHSDRRLHLNSFVAYLVFTVLLGGGFFALYDARTGNMVRERNDAVAERDSARHRVTELSDELAGRDAAHSSAFEFFKLLRDGNTADAIARHTEVERERLTPTERELFDREIEKARGEIVDAGYLTGIDAFRRNDFDKAVTELRRGLAYQADGARAAQMRYYLGAALQQKGDSENAVRELELAMAGGVEQAGMVDARFYLAQALEQLGRLSDARAEYEKFASANPKSPLALAARRMATQLSRAAVPRN